MSDVWVLTDHKAGTAAQATALADILGLQYDVKRLVYNAFALIPNFILGGTLLHINQSASSDLSGSDGAPKLIISAGRRAASAAIALKRRFKDLKIVQIMRPFLDSASFDLIVLPQHDIFDAEYPNIIRVIGSLHNIQSRLLNAGVEFHLDYPTMHNFIGVLIGGVVKKYRFSEEDAMRLAKILNNVSSNHGIPLFITFSRRTPDIVKQVFHETFEWPHVMYDPLAKDAKKNPYSGILSQASFIISTCDSISMCSEATASGKPLYIFCPENKDALKKHRYFVQQLLDLGVARILENNTETLQQYSYEPFNEAEKVAKYIKEHVLV